MGAVGSSALAVGNSALVVGHHRLGLRNLALAVVLRSFALAVVDQNLIHHSLDLHSFALVVISVATRILDSFQGADHTPEETLVVAHDFQNYYSQ